MQALQVWQVRQVPMQTDPRGSLADPRSGQVFTFGPFEVNLRTGELRKHGIRLSLQDQPLRILAALLERPGEAVSREDLCKRLWPGGTFVDFEHSLNAAVRRLRVALGDDADTPRFIETVHRRGYRFLVWRVSGRAGDRLGDQTGPIRLAVLPFVSFSRDDNERGQRSQEVFGEGLTEETITQLASRCPRHIGVIARTSVMRLFSSGDGEQSAAEAGRVLGADYLVEGSIRREGNRIRIVAQLIESQEETHLWAATFDRLVTFASDQRSAVSEQQSAVSHQRAAVSEQRSAVSDQRSVVTDRVVVTDRLTLQAEVAQRIAEGVLDALSEKKAAAGF
jgi:TolB-like protein/DNA-binding winged helix-turn-helix (wHTH) protein